MKTQTRMRGAVKGSETKARKKLEEFVASVLKNIERYKEEIVAESEVMPEKVTLHYLGKKYTQKERDILCLYPRGEERVEIQFAYFTYVDRHPSRTWSDDMTFKFWWENIREGLPPPL